MIVPMSFVLYTAFLMEIACYKVKLEDGVGMMHEPLGKGELHLAYRRKTEKTLVGNITIYTTGEGCTVNCTSFWLVRNIWTPCERYHGDLCGLLNKWSSHAEMEKYRKHVTNIPYACPWSPNITFVLDESYGLLDDPPYQYTTPKTATATKGDIVVECGGAVAFTMSAEYSFDRTGEVRRRKPTKKNLG